VKDTHLLLIEVINSRSWIKL